MTCRIDLCCMSICMNWFCYFCLSLIGTYFRYWSHLKYYAKVKSIFSRFLGSLTWFEPEIKTYRSIRQVSCPGNSFPWILPMYILVEQWYTRPCYWIQCLVSSCCHRFGMDLSQMCPNSRHQRYQWWMRLYWSWNPRVRCHRMLHRERYTEIHHPYIHHCMCSRMCQGYWYKSRIHDRRVHQ